MASSSLSPWLSREVGAVLLLATGASVALVSARVSSGRRRHDHDSRFGISEHAFTEHLCKSGVDPVIAATAYRYLQEIQDVRSPILPGDVLDWDLGLDDDQVKATLAELTRRLARQPARVSQLPVTVEDLIRTVQGLPQCGTAAAA